MRAVIGKSRASGAVTAPPSKSAAHRLLICAGLAAGESVISGVELSEDVKATLRCLDALGVKCAYRDGDVAVYGNGRTEPEGVLDCGECGSTLRFFVPLCLLSEKTARLTGSKRLMERPLDAYRRLCEENGLYYRLENGVLTVRGPLKSGSYSLPADVSSQFISGLLFALPLTDGDSELHLTGKIESRPYIDLTLSALGRFGIEAVWRDERTIFIKGGQSYKSRSATVEGDYSNAAFFDAFNHIGGAVAVDGLERDSIQGDRIYKAYFPLLDAGRPTLDVADCPDLAPVLFALAACKNGGVFTGAARLKIKESDRGAAMAAELAKCGVRTVAEDGRITVESGVRPPSGPLCGHNDHRIVMALTVLLSTVGGEIEGAEAVNKSLPSFFDLIKKIGVECKLYE